jgi:CCR4-NOT transcription complex subunit 1
VRHSEETGRFYSLFGNPFFIRLSEAASANSRLSSLLLEAGYDCCSSVSSLENLIQQAGDIKETDVAQALGLMARTHTNLNGVGDGTEGNTWNVRNFANAIKKTVSL